jgi:hypothetical protein
MTSAASNRSSIWRRPTSVVSPVTDEQLVPGAEPFCRYNGDNRTRASQIHWSRSAP